MIKMTSPLNLALLIEAEELLEHLADDRLRIIDLSRSSVHAQLHIPQAVHLKPAMLLAQDEYASGLLPDVASLQALVSHLNISAQHHVVIYDDEGGAWAGRLMWNLHCMGFEHVSVLNGGIHAWLAAGFISTNAPTQLAPVADLFQVNINRKYQIAYVDLLAQVAAQQIQLWDCRSKEEYTGQRLAARHGGHIPGALHFEWSTALNRENHLKLHSLERIQQRLQQSGFDLSQPVVAYCQSHHRSGLAYLVGRLLDWDIQAYDGAWSEWGNRLDSPIITGELPS